MDVRVAAARLHRRILLLRRLQKGLLLLGEERFGRREVLLYPLYPLDQQIDRGLLSLARREVRLRNDVLEPRPVGARQEQRELGAARTDQLVEDAGGQDDGLQRAPLL